MAFVIKDVSRNEYYRQRAGSNSWYSKDINHSRLFVNERVAQQTIDMNGHHVSYPGDRVLEIKEVHLVEV